MFKLCTRWPLVRIHMFYGKRILCDYFLRCVLSYIEFICYFMCWTFKLRQKDSFSKCFLSSFFFFISVFLLFVLYLLSSFRPWYWRRVHTHRPTEKKRVWVKEKMGLWVQMWDQQRILHKSVCIWPCNGRIIHKCFISMDSVIVVLYMVLNLLSFHLTGFYFFFAHILTLFSPSLCYDDDKKGEKENKMK